MRTFRTHDDEYRRWTHALEGHRERRTPLAAFYERHLAERFPGVEDVPVVLLLDAREERRHGSCINADAFW